MSNLPDSVQVDITVHWIGHILRRDSLLRVIIEGRTLGKATEEGNIHESMTSPAQLPEEGSWRHEH